VVIDGAAHRFCCADCADSYQKILGTETGKILREHVGLGMRVADLGCGSGFYSVQLAERIGPKGHVYALDLDPTNVRRTEEYLARRGLLDRVTVGEATVGRLALLPDGALDFLLSNNVLCCTNDRAGARREIVRVLRSGGVAHVRVSDVSPRGVRPLSEGEWIRWLTPFRRLDGGVEAGARWALLMKSPPRGPAREPKGAIPKP
jgi:ubiquinone/menaquinone biosynthesis C-methylase UbiE